MSHAGQFRQAMEDGDHLQLWRIWAEAMPHLPAPKTEEQAEIVMHRARTEAESMPLAKRAWSHAWLSDRGLQSGLPDELKPAAEQMRPRVVSAVGIAVRVPEIFRPVGYAVQLAMAEAVEDLHADGADLSDRPLVHGRMFAAREDTLQRLLGTSSLRRAAGGREFINAEH